MTLPCPLPPCRLHQTDAMQQRLGVTHISGRPVLTLGLSKTSRLKSRDPPVTQPSFHTAPSPAGTSGGGSVFGSAQGTHSMESSWPLECWPVWPLLPLKTASCFRQPHGLPHRTAQRCLCTLSRVPSPLSLNQPHHPSQISTGTGSFNHLWQTANNTSPVSRQRLATSSSSKSRPQTGRRILDKGSLVSTHPTIITSFVRMMSFFFVAVVFVVPGGWWGHVSTRPPHRQDRSGHHSALAMAPRLALVLSNHMSIHPPIPTHTAPSMAWPCGTSYIRLVSSSGRAGMPLSQQQVSVSFRAGCAVLHSRVGEAVFVRRDCGLSWTSGSYTQSQTDGSASVLEHGRRMGSLPREEELDACLGILSSGHTRRCGFCLERRRR